MNRILFAALAVIALALPLRAGAEPLAEAGSREHDGFFLQLQLGGAFQSLSFRDDAVTVSGSGTGFNVAVGGAPIPNFVIFGELFSQVAFSPSIEQNGWTATTNSDVSLSFTGMGPGVAYYFGPSSFFVSGTLSYVTASFEGPGGKATAKGAGVRLGLGKEWWLSDQWGLGLAGNYYVASVSDEFSDLTASCFMLSLSATYN